MPRDRDWVDYANLASNVIQNAQLSSLNGKMQELAELTRHKEYREQQEAAVAHCEDILRDAVFFYTEQLRDVEEIASKNPVAAYIRASHLKVTYEGMPQFKASGFRKYEDKERLTNAQRTCDRLIRDSAARLSPEQLADAKTCVEHLFDREQLLKIIEVQKEREKLERLEAPTAKRAAPLLAELNEIALKQARAGIQLPNPVRKICVAVVVLGLGTVLLLFACGSLYYLIDERRAERFMTGEGMERVAVILFAGAAVAGFGGLVLLAPKLTRSMALKSLAAQQAQIARRLAEVNREIDRIKAIVNQNQSLFAKFGEATSEGYRNMLNERDKLLAKMTGESAKGFTHPDR